tara:strand:- start:632 stop:793 length:162 start_codon:yes stop_codon:yes gene_type:complete
LDEIPSVRPRERASLLLSDLRSWGELVRGENSEMGMFVTHKVLSRCALTFFDE